ncbi:MAG: 50S ribosomal protein L15 [Flavobacteriales bacterium]|nr:50S ribosomal protein L15 [Flavobacteriales bacterium]
MDLSNLQPAEGTTKQRKRIGRGQGSGRGGTSTRGHKGAKSRSGYSRKIGFEGGQMPLQKRVPKFGFTNINRKEFKGVNLDTLQFLADTKKVKSITKEVLVENGLVAKKDLVKILGRGELTAKLDVTVDSFSASAKAAIEKAGGKTTALYVPKGEKTQEETKTKKAAAPKAEKKVEEVKAEAKEEKIEKKAEETAPKAKKEEDSKADDSKEDKED